MSATFTDRIYRTPASAKLAAVTAVVAVLTLAAYSNSFHAAFHLDDFHQISRNPNILDLSNVYRFFTENGVNTTLDNVYFYRPVTTSSFALSYALGGMDVFGFHVFNVMLHIMNALLVFLVIREVLTHSGYAETFLTPLAVCLVFALHPLQTSAVTYISGRAVLLAGLFSLSSLYCFIRFRRSGTAGVRIIWGAAAPVLFLLGIMSKEMAFAVVGVMVVHDLLFGPASGKRSASIWLYYLAFAAATAVFAGARYLIGVGTGSATVDYTVYEYMISEAKVILDYARLMVAPIGQNADYALPLTRSVDPAVVLSALFVGASLYGLYRVRRIMPELSFFGFWFFIMLLPESSFFPILDIKVEYRLYLPSVGFIAVAVLLFRRAVHIPKLRTAAAVMVLAVLGVLTFNRNAVFATEYTYWSDVAKKSPQSARAATNLGAALVKENRFDEAIPVLRRALEIRTVFSEPHIVHEDLGICYEKTGRMAEAADEYEAAIKSDPYYLGPYSRLGYMYFESGVYEKAADVFRRLTEVSPKDQEALYNLAISLMLAGNDGEAIGYMNSALASGADSFDIRYNLALLYERTGRTKEAVEQAVVAARLAGDDTQYNDTYDLLARLRQAGG